MLFQMTLFCGTNIYTFSAVKWLIVSKTRKCYVYILNLFIFDIIDMNTNILYTCKYFPNICCMCVFLYIHNTYIQYSTQILCKQKLLFWMWIIVINHLTLYIYIYIYIYIYRERERERERESASECRLLRQMMKTLTKAEICWIKLLFYFPSGNIVLRRNARGTPSALSSSESYV